MEALDKAYEVFKELRIFLPEDDEKVITESDTRFKLIDPILTEVLGWPKVEILTELSGPQGRLDYLVADADGHGLAVVEAKARSTELVLPGKRGERYKLSGPVFRAAYATIAEQVAPYCMASRVAIGILTNGTQWLAFFGNRIDGVALDDDYGIAFGSLEDIDEQFERFYQVFSYEGVRSGQATAILSGPNSTAEIRSDDARRPVEPRSSNRLSRTNDENRQYYLDLEAMLEGVFRPIHEDPDMLLDCFVDSRESRDADQRLARLTEDVVAELIEDSEAYADHVEDNVEHLGDSGLAGGTGGALVQLVGERSAGKTTFLRRFYARTLSRGLRNKIYYIHINIDTLSQISRHHLASALAEELETELFGDEGPDNGQLLELYRRDWERERRQLPDSADDNQIRLEFTRALQAKTKEDPVEHAVRLCEFAVSNRRRVPCVVLDDFDLCSESEVRDIFSFAVLVVGRLETIVTLAMDDTTLWRHTDLDILSRKSPVTFWLHRPLVREVLSKRFEYIKKYLAASAEPAQRRRLGARLGRSGLRWVSNPDQLVATLQSVLIWDHQEVVNWIGTLSNHDIREVLDISRKLLCSPIIRIEEHFGATVTSRPPTRNRILRALISPEHETYHPNRVSHISNIFGFGRDGRFSLLLPMRVLSVLKASLDRDASFHEGMRGFQPVVQLQDVFERIGYSRATTLECLERMRKSGLVQNYDPSLDFLRATDRLVKINPRGELHLDWSRQEDAYVRMMAETDQIIDFAAWETLKNLWSERREMLRSGSPDRGESLQKLSLQSASVYTSYLLQNAAQVSGSDFEATAIQRQEDALRAKWSSATGAVRVVG